MPVTLYRYISSLTQGSRPSCRANVINPNCKIFNDIWTSVLFPRRPNGKKWYLYRQLLGHNIIYTQHIAHDVAFCIRNYILTQD